MLVSQFRLPGRSQHALSRLILSLILVFTLNACGPNLANLDALPNDFDINGSWQFVSQDQSSYERFTRSARQVTARITAELIQRGESRLAREQAEPNRMLLDVLVNLLSLPRDEIFFQQGTNTIEIDYGVAGYHVFNIGQATKLLMGGAELDAVAGWKDGSLVVHIKVTNEFDIYQRFRLMDNRNLLESMEIAVAAGNTISHQRWYRR